MPTLVLEPQIPEMEALAQRRRRAGIDRLDEVWEGVLHMVPAPNDMHADIGQQLAIILDAPARDAGLFPTMHEFNVGGSVQDYRVPDGGLHRERRWGTWEHTLPLVVEIVSPGDETWEKLPFYAARKVDEVLIVDPQQRAVHWLALQGGGYQPIERSGLIELGPAELAARIDWP